ncbi:MULTISPECIES: DinB family protein [Streptomyces]|uniref:DinB family protein n=1 Tax=Streptomyces lonegramiae TaxID=3075524 RepID=A0ABU2XNH5_9ACTN|nr:DinB family protein [Streptomyces sp. DSM 41529]MDT0547474.1 DinB family protein [Streptomyces sp. DSM 41529]
MRELEALLREYDRARAYTDELWKDLTPDEVTWRPHENSSAIGWHLGHQAHVASSARPRSRSTVRGRAAVGSPPRPAR